MDRQTYLYVGCYTHESPIGIHVYDWSDPAGPLVEWLVGSARAVECGLIRVLS